MVVTKSDKTLSPFAAPSEPTSSLKQALPQILAVCVKNVLLLGFGMTLGFPTILIPSLSGTNSEETISLGQEALSWIGSINLICVPVGCLLSGAITQPLGRKRAMQLVNIPFLMAWLIFYFSTEVWQVFLALAITGVSGGLLEAPTLTYVAEVTQPSLRGILASTSTIAVILGILIEFFLGAFFHWKAVAVGSCLAPCISFVLLFFVPESPHWLLSNDRLPEAQQSLAWLRGWVDVKEVEAEFEELSKQILRTSQVNNTRLKNWTLFAKKSFLRPYALVCFTFFLGHFSGMTTLQTYAVAIFATLRAPIDEYHATIFLGVAEVLGCILSACLVHYVGKRVMNFVSLIGCGVCFLTAATYSYLINVHNFEDAESGNKTWVPMSLLIGAAFFSHSGIRILPWMLIGEVYTNQTRATASGLSGGMSYIFGFISNKIFLTLVFYISLPGTFWMYSGCCLVGTIVLYFILPETEGKTLFEIQQHFSGAAKLDNNIYQKQEIRTNGNVNHAFNRCNKKGFNVNISECHF